MRKQTIVERHLNDEQCRKRMHEQKYTPTDLEEVGRTALERTNYVAALEEGRHNRDQNTVVQPNPGGINTVKTQEHLEYKQLAQWKREHLTRHSQNPLQSSGHRGHHGTWSPSARSLGGMNPHRDTRGDYLTWPHSTRPEQHSSLLQKRSTGRLGAVRPISASCHF